MLRTLIGKEIVGHLLSLRCHLAVALILALLAGGALVYRGELARQAADHAAAESARAAELAEASASWGPLFTMYSYTYHRLFARPAALGFIADGHARQLPNAAAANAFRISEVEVQQRANPMLMPFEALDWVLVVGVVLSFAALVLTFDAVAGEREDGTLRLLLAGPVPRSSVVLAKAAGAWLVLALALALGVAVQLLLLLPGGRLVLDPALLLRLAASLGLCLLYVAVFVLLGLLISTLHRSSATALVVALLVWAVLVVIVPRSASLLADAVVEVAPRGHVGDASWEAVEAASDEFLRLNPAATPWFSGAWSPGESLELAFTIWRAWDRPWRQWRGAQLAQVAAARALCRVSPTVLLAEGLERTAGTGIVAYRTFLEAVDRYRAALEQGLRARHPLDPVNGYQMDAAADAAVRAVPVSVADLPAFDDRPAPVRAAVAGAAVPAAVLALLAAVLLVATMLAAARYDVR